MIKYRALVIGRYMKAVTILIVNSADEDEARIDIENKLKAQGRPTILDKWIKQGMLLREY